MLSSSIAESSEDQPKVEKLYLKKKGIGSEARAERMANTDVDLQLLGNAERERQLQKQKRRRRQGHEDEVCDYIAMAYFGFCGLCQLLFLLLQLLVKAT